MDINPYLEDLDSQIPAIQLLTALGWNYLNRDEALKLREGREDKVVLTGILRPWLRENNSFHSRGKDHPFSDKGINEAVRRLLDEPFDGLVRTNEKIYNLLNLGTSVPEALDGDTKGRTLRYIDWENWDNNDFHVTDEFSVERQLSHSTRRPDLVLFVNGIPFVVIECKRRDRDNHGERQVDKGAMQLIGYQKSEEIPQLFQYAQLLLSTSVNDVRYATVGTPLKFWSVWHEEELSQLSLNEATNTRLPATTLERLLQGRDKPGEAETIRRHYDALWAGGERLPTEQDHSLWAMLRRERLIGYVHNAVVFDAGVRKVARHQQYFAVRQALRRTLTLRDGRRLGGVVWHTTGSGKSLTMVMLAKALALEPSFNNPRVVLVTDRIDLDEQLGRTFEACGKPVVRAKTGEELVRLIKEGKAGVFSAVINKFDTVIKRKGTVDESPDIFILVDEGHRSNYSSLAVAMRRVFPNGCFVGFTGTPLHKKDKNTAQRFGGFIHSYSMRSAVDEESVLRLIYEGRVAELEQNKEAMDAWFERLTADLNDAQKADLKRKMSRKEVLHNTEPRIMLIAWDISQHFIKNFRATGLKGQLAANSRTSAILYRQYLQQFGIDCEVIMSQPDTRADAESTEDEDKSLVKRFWDEMMERFGNEDEYNKQIKASFGREDGVEILIVVYKLLTGFDEPRNTVLYVDKQLKEHNILQAIARVNRLFDDSKETGFIIDYRGIFGDLNKAMKYYDALADFDADDVALNGVLIDSAEELAKLPQRHSDLWAVFKEVKNNKDAESMERHLWPEDVRHEFYDALSAYQRTLAVALATEGFYQKTPQERIEQYKTDLKYFRELRSSVQSRFAETVDFARYEKQIRRMMDTHIHAPQVGVITDMVDIFDQDAFDAEVERVEGSAAKADTIANRLKKTITEHMEEDEIFYRKFGELVDQAIEDYYNGRISDAEYLQRVSSYKESVRTRTDGRPLELNGHLEAGAYFGLLNDLLGGKTENNVREEPEKYANDSIGKKLTPERFAQIALDIEGTIERHKVRDWPNNDGVINEIERDIDDYLFDLRDSHGIELTIEDIDHLIERFISVAKKLEGA